MELLQWVIIAAQAVVLFHLWGKVSERSLAAKAQRILREWRMGEKGAWEAEYNGVRGAQPGPHALVKAVRDREGKWVTWQCVCGQTGHNHHTDWRKFVRAHYKDMKMVG